ncbi:ABC transporter permease [Paenibacillus harenae]|uniref:ABC-2 type transport system permease protein n=1 Tax=Paenibacillus harenae TaxID=306543 RepID=A0ABT9U622_PAEHA|nr:ABC transporter permease [Paenibacillus harenae]MDQ0114506.1 ABC-2 type transport system permease protein [Paenibacillus harenae]
MKETIWLVRRMALNTVKNYKMMLLYLCLPIFGILLSSSIYSNADQPPLKVGVVNPDGGQSVSKDLVAYISKLDQVEVREIRAVEAKGLLKSGELDTALTLPKGFADSVLTGGPANVSLASVQGSQVAPYIKSYVNAYIGNLASIGLASGGEQAKFNELYKSFLHTEFGLTIDKVEDRSVQHRKSAQTVGYLIMLMLFSAVNLSSMILKEKENRTLFRLFAAPITGRAYVGANVIVNVFVMLIQIVVTLVVMTRLFHMESGIPVGQLFLLLGLFALVAVGLSLAIVAFSSSSMAASGIQTMVIIPTCLLAGCLFPIATMPAFMQQIAQFLPQYWLLDTVGRLQQGEPASGVLLNLAILLAFALVLSMTAAYKFGRNKELHSFI